MAQPYANAQVIAAKATIAAINTMSIYTLIQDCFSKEKLSEQGLKNL
jgi:hypothetical protein